MLSKQFLYFTFVFFCAFSGVVDSMMENLTIIPTCSDVQQWYANPQMLSVETSMVAASKSAHEISQELGDLLVKLYYMYY